MVRKKSQTSHLLLRRTYSGKLFDRHHSYNRKRDVAKEARRLRREGNMVRVHKSPSEKLHYTIYKRKGR